MMKKKMPTRQQLGSATKRAHKLIETMLKEMQAGLKHRDKMESDAWERLFGSKQSVVVNLQKLVQTLATLPGDEKEGGMNMPHQEDDMLTSEEMEMLAVWLAEKNAQETSE